jgi:hypothetical protein
MNTSFKQLNKPNNEFTKFIINKLRDSKDAISASTLCMIMKENLPEKFHPNKGDFNKWMKNLYNIEIDNSNPDMPFYKFKMTKLELFEKYKLNDTSYVKILLNKIQNEHSKWSKLHELYITTHHNQSTWDNLNDIFNSLSQNIKTFDEKFPNYSIIIDKFRINKMPNKDNIENIPVKELNYKSALEAPPGLLNPKNEHHIHNNRALQPSYQTPHNYQIPPTYQTPPAYQTPPTYQTPRNYQTPPAYQTPRNYQTPINNYQTPINNFQTSQVPQIPPIYQIPHNNSYQLFPEQQTLNSLSTELNFFDSLSPLPDQNKKHIDVDSLLGLELYPNNNFNEIVKQLSLEELAFLENIHAALKNIEGSVLCKLIKEIGRVRNIVFM